MKGNEGNTDSVIEKADANNGNVLIPAPKNQQASSAELLLLPFGNDLLQIKNSVSDLNLMLHAEHQLDPSVALASNELQSFENDIQIASKRIIEALAKRESVQNEVNELSQKVSKAANDMHSILMIPQEQMSLTDTKNDVAFAFSLIPLAVAVVGLIIRRGA